MKKFILLTPIFFLLASCAELTSLANSFRPHTMPDYEFYEKFSETADINVVLPIAEKNLTTIYENGVNERVFSFSSLFVNKKTFTWYQPDDSYNFNNKVWYFNEIKKNKVQWIKLSFSHVLSLTKSNFYKIFNVSPNDITINQLKKHCDSYRRVTPLYILTMKNGKNLYIVEDMGSGSAGSSSNLFIFRKLPTCGEFELGKTINEYGNDFFNQ